MDGLHHAPHARRTHHTQANVPSRKDDRAQKKIAVAIGAGVTMVVVVALYVASFRQNVLFREARDSAPRWSVIEDGIVQGAAQYEPQASEAAAIKDTLVSMVKAKVLQAKSIDIMKDKIGSASGTRTQNN